MVPSLNLTGTWVGCYYYGADYGEKLHGEKVKFMFFLSQHNNEFEGTTVDYEGIGSDFQKGTIKGFIKDNFISFIKQYPVLWEIDDENTLIKDESKVSPEIHYTGDYDQKTKTFSGKWEMVIHTESDLFGDMEYLNTGSWEMKKED